MFMLYLLPITRMTFDNPNLGSRMLLRATLALLIIVWRGGTDKLYHNNTDNYCNSLPSFYLINPTSLAKPNAICHLHTDMINFHCDIALVVETWFTKNIQMTIFLLMVLISLDLIDQGKGKVVACARTCAILSTVLLWIYMLLLALLMWTLKCFGLPAVLNGLNLLFAYVMFLQNLYLPCSLSWYT